MKLSVLAWAEERLANSLRLASEKTGADRTGWLEDASYWSPIITALKAFRAGTVPECPACGHTFFCPNCSREIQ